MTDQEKLYEVMGELLYAVAKADGVIQKEETDALNELLKSHQWAKEINWSFYYENDKGHSVDDVYKKVIDYCINHGPSAEYQEFIDAMKIVAEASNGIDKNEAGLIDGFSNTLITRFKADIASQ